MTNYPFYEVTRLAREIYTKVNEYALGLLVDTYINELIKRIATVVTMKNNSDFDLACLCTHLRKEKPMNNAEWLCRDYERFKKFFLLLAEGKFTELEIEYGFKVDTDVHDDFNKWLCQWHD